VRRSPLIPGSTRAPGEEEVRRPCLRSSLDFLPSLSSFPPESRRRVEATAAGVAAAAGLLVGAQFLSSFLHLLLFHSQSHCGRDRSNPPFPDSVGTRRG